MVLDIQIKLNLLSIEIFLRLDLKFICFLNALCLFFLKLRRNALQPLF